MADDSAAPPAPAATGLHKLSISRQQQPRGRRRPWRWLIAALLLAGVAVVALMPRAAEVQVATVQLSTPSQQYVQLSASGYVVAQRRAAVASKATGRLIELLVREGSLLKKGELIARLDASDVQAAIGAAQAGVRLAEAGLAQSHSALRQAEVELANADAEAARARSLATQGFVSTQALDAAQRRQDLARAAQAQARAGRASAEAGVAQAQAQLKVQQVSRDFTEIRAPFDGVVLVKNANVGDIITPFSSATGTQGAVVTMADLGTLEVEADVSESSLAKVARDQAVEITLDALPGLRLRGQVAGIVPTVDRAKATVMTKLRFEQLDPRILPEMSAKVAFLSQRPSDAEQQPVLALNPRALRERDGAQQVLRLRREGEQERVEVVAVKPGRKLGDLLEVSGTLKAGDRLVLDPPATLKDGAAVKPSAKP